MDFFGEIKIWLILKLIFFLIKLSESAVMPPPWANPTLNPCASKPRGWQLLFWPPDGKCYQIFQIGHPCPEGMELSPTTSKSGKQLYAECRCPPETAQYANDGRCYRLFSRGPCENDYYFGPDTAYKTNNTSKRQWGTCKQMKICEDSNHLYWPKDNKCHQKLTRGPCSKGHLITLDSNTMPTCACNKQKELRNFRYFDGYCYQHFTKGPCREKGHLFLPDRTCGCYSYLPHFHEETQKCFELGKIGPCGKGEIFTISPETGRGSCLCRQDYIRYQNSTTCNRPYTQGPCPKGQILVNTTSCIPQPCGRGELFFPDENRCFRIGSRGPCPLGKIVTFDFNTRPSLDGISYNGLCQCERKDCSVTNIHSETCDNTKGYVKFRDDKQCYKLYTRGPCPRGEWLAPKRQGKSDRDTRNSDDGKIIVDSDVRDTELNPDKKLVVYQLKDSQKNNSDTSNSNPSDSAVRELPEKLSIKITNSHEKNVTINNDGGNIVIDLFSNSDFLINSELIGVCECVAGHIRKVRMIGETTYTECASPTLILADYLNENFAKNSDSTQVVSS